MAIENQLRENEIEMLDDNYEIYCNNNNERK